MQNQDSPDHQNDHSPEHHLPDQPPSGAPEPDNDSPGIAEFPRVSVLLFVALSMLTFGIYFTYWMYSRSQIINRQLGPRGLSGSFVSLAVTAYAVYVGLAFYFQGNPDRPDIILVYDIFALITNVLFLVWIFQIRKRLHLILHAQKGQRAWCNAFLTFFFHAFYVQYKINQNLDDETNQVVRRYTREL